MTIAEFKGLLRTAEPQFRDIQCRLSPASFANEASASIPRNFDWRWSSCDDVLRGRVQRGVMMRLPTSWQIEPALHAVCRSLHVPIFACDPNNIPLAAAALEATALDAVVTVPDSFAAELSARSVPLPATWLFIHNVEDDTWPAHETMIPDARHEVHIFPGFPILTSCEKGNFHTIDEYEWEFQTNTAHITSHNDLFPFAHLEVPAALKQQGTCTCGKKVIRRV